METTPAGIVKHRSAGRIRFKVAEKKRDHSYFDNARSVLSTIDGVDGVFTNPETSSILVLHHMDSALVIGNAEARGIFTLKKADKPANPVHGTVTEAFNTINQRIKSFTDGGFDIPGAAFLALVGVGVYQISRGNFTAPAWYTAFWYAMNIFLKSKDSAE